MTLGVADFDCRHTTIHLFRGEIERLVVEIPGTHYFFFILNVVSL